MEKLKELQTQQHTEVLQEIDDAEEAKKVMTKNTIFDNSGKLSDFIQ